MNKIYDNINTDKNSQSVNYSAKIRCIAVKLKIVVSKTAESLLFHIGNYIFHVNLPTHVKVKNSIISVSNIYLGGKPTPGKGRQGNQCYM
jgi:hypothetical protein